ncbi:MAG: hypothetical protein AABW73_02620 [Nanoarchaeota archaeon]
MTLKISIPKVVRGRLEPKQGGIYLVEVDDRYMKGDAQTVLRPRYGYYEGPNGRDFTFLVPEEEGLRYGEKTEAGIAQYRAMINKPVKMIKLEGREEEIPGFEIKSRYRITDQAILNHSKAILKRIGLTARVEEVEFVQD